MQNRTAMELESGIFELREIGVAIKNTGQTDMDVQTILRGIDSRINSLAAEKAALQNVEVVPTTTTKKS